MNFTIALKNAPVLLLILVLLAGCDSQYSKLDEADVNREQKLLAEDIAVKLMTGMKTGDYHQPGDEATRMIQRGLTPEVQEEVYESISGQFGDFISLKYVETWKPTDGSEAGGFSTIHFGLSLGGKIKIIPEFSWHIQKSFYPLLVPGLGISVNLPLKGNAD